MRCVIDTGVWVSAMLAPDSVPRRAVNLARSQGRVLLSAPGLDELSQVLRRQGFRRYFDEEDVARLLAALARECSWVNVDVEIRACRDPGDDKFLSLAVSGNASCLVTGDEDLLALDPFCGIRILNPRSLLEEAERR